MEREELLKIQKLLVTASDMLRKKYDFLTTEEVILFADITSARSQILEILWQK